MRVLLLSLIALSTLFGQTQLPALNTIIGTEITCKFESQDAVGGLFSECTNNSTAEIISSQIVSALDSGSIVGTGEIMCLYWKESTKFRLQCGNAGKISFDGYIPSVTRKKRWYIIWR